jgi:hypothetical protein
MMIEKEIKMKNGLIRILAILMLGALWWFTWMQARHLPDFIP